MRKKLGCSVVGAFILVVVVLYSCMNHQDVSDVPRATMATYTHSVSTATPAPTVTPSRMLSPSPSPTPGPTPTHTPTPDAVAPAGVSLP